MQGFLDVSSRSLHHATIARKDSRSSRALLLASSTYSPIFSRALETKFSWFSSLLPDIDNQQESIKPTIDHKETEQATKIHDFVLGPEEHAFAHSIRMTILNLHGRNVDDVVQALQSIHHCNEMKLTSNIVDSLLQKFGDDWKSALGFFQWTSFRPEYKHTSHAYNKIVDLLGKMRQMDQMWNVVEKMRIEGFITLETVAKIMRRLAGSGRWRDAVNFFDDLGRIGFTKDTESMNLLLDTLCKERKVKLAREVFMELKAIIPADAHTYNIFVHGWCSVRRIEEALWTIQEMRGHGFLPSVITYSTVLKVYSNQSNIHKVYELFDQMVAEGCPPNVVSYTIVINSLAKSHAIEEALNVVERMKSSGCKPDVRLYNTLINTLGKSRRLDDAFHIFDVEMARNGVSPDLSTYNILISLFCEHEQEHDALSVLKEMECCSCKPVLQTYYPLLKLCFRMGKLGDHLKSLLSDIATKDHLSLDLDTYTLLIHGLCGAGNVEWAYFLFEEMIDREIFPRFRTCRLLLDLSVQKNMNVAVESIQSFMRTSKFGGANW
ncbi:Pentatricopeptide repeat-containing protein [Platanthera guangdongensis]|uniref:Pentatricopeptide repeat-containing protein n=1 Tax=Platanthera guangdongensis TaxID=2320717 RepID=A0ABR2M5I8_9ASPA